MRVALTGGAYTARSLIANAQRCVNLYPEANADDSPVPITHYPTPGLDLIGTPLAGEVRGIYQASNGNTFIVVGATLFLGSEGTYQTVGVIGSTAGPVSMVDNGVTLCLVDGNNGFWIDINTLKFTQITDAAFYGADKVDYVDGYFVFNKPGTPQWYISNYQSTTFNPLYIASKSTYSDNLSTLAVMHREIWLFGEKTTEVWSNTGAADFPLGRMPGVFIEHGCAAKHSVAKIDLALFWLSQDLQGKGIVLMGQSYSAHRISTHAIELAIAGYDTISDAIGFSYQQEGHAFYFLTFPSANATWCYDVATGKWHERAYLEIDGTLSRHRANCHAYVDGKNLVGDWQNGNIYALDLNTYTDNGNPIVRIRSLPHIGGNGKRTLFRQLIVDMEVGQGLPDDSAEPELRLRWSDDRGLSWGNYVVDTLGKKGRYNHLINYQRLGYARDRVFELSWSAPVRTALNGAFVDLSVARS